MDKLKHPITQVLAVGGTGKMLSAILKGANRSSLAITTAGTNPNKKMPFTHHITSATQYPDRGCEYLVMGTKPQQFAEALREYATKLGQQE